MFCCVFLSIFGALIPQQIYSTTTKEVLSYFLRTNCSFSACLNEWKIIYGDKAARDQKRSVINASHLKLTIKNLEHQKTTRSINNYIETCGIKKGVPVVVTSHVATGIATNLVKPAQRTLLFYRKFWRIFLNHLYTCKAVS